MRKGTKIRIGTLTATQGHVMESLRHEYEAKHVGVVDEPVEPEGWFAVKFNTVDGKLMVHREMMDPVRAR